MEIGIGLPMSERRKIEKIGFDYIEAPLFPLQELEDSAFDSMRQEVREGRCRPLCFNGMFPGNLPLLGPMSSQKKIGAYLDLVLSRAAVLGAELIVFGSGTARRRPEDMEPSEAFERLAERTRFIGDKAAAYGLTVAIEPLQPLDCNMITSLRQGLELVRAVGHPAVWLLADNYHMAGSGDSFQDLAACMPWLRHVHVAAAKPGDPSVRYYPDSCDAYDTAAFIHALLGNGYTGRVSLECLPASREEEMTAALQALRNWSSCQ